MALTHRKHRIESLENRQMMAADIDLVGGDLQITGSDQADLVSIAEGTINGRYYNSGLRRWVNYSLPTIRAEISNASGSIVKNYTAAQVTKITANLGDGNDTFNNFSSETTFVHGENGNDTLLGGPGRDHFFGGNHNDTLYGRAGRDVLDGGNHNDGLFGGEDFDVMIGRGGSDRFLRDTRSPDYVVDARSADATITFKPGAEIIESELYGRNGRLVFEAGNWQDHEIEMVDAALKEMHDLTGTDHFLERHDNTPLNFVRYGQVTDLFGNTPYDFSVNDEGRIVAFRKYVGGNNDDAGNIGFTNDAFTLGDRFVRQTTIHEIGHNFDEQHENVRLGNLGLVNLFRQQSGWDYLSNGEEVSSWQTTSQDGAWAHNRSATFVRDYGRTNPLEDFATTFTAYVMGNDYNFDEADSADGVTSGRQLAPNKFAVLDMMFDLWGA